jgi:HEAT repeat protein
VQAELLGGLSGRKDMRAFDVLVRYATDRNPGLRKKAVVALADLPDKRVQPILVAALADSVAEVRAAGARALAKQTDRSPAVEDALVKLLMHQDAVAVEVLGAIGGPGTARRLGELFGQVPDGLLANTFAELLHRADFGPDPIRVEVVKTIGKLTGPEATSALREYIALTDAESEKGRPSRAEAKKLIEQRGAN